jgi:hypothetical protein
VTVRLIWAFPRRGRGLISEYCVDGADGILWLHDEYDPRSRFALRFLGVEAYSFTRDTLCTLDQVEAIDKVLELESSGWGASVAQHRASAGQPALHHYCVYLEGAGAYDVLAEAFLPDDVMSSPGFEPPPIS